MVMTWEAKAVAAADAAQTNWKHKVTPDWGDLIIDIHCQIQSISVTLEKGFEGQSNWKINKTTPPGYEIDICIFHYLCLGDKIIF